MITQIRLLLEEQYDQCFRCLLFHLHLFDEISYGFASLFEFKVEYSNVFGVQKFRKFTVNVFSSWDLSPCLKVHIIEPRCEGLELRSWGFPTRSDTNRAVQPQKMARGLKFRI